MQCGVPEVWERTQGLYVYLYVELHLGLEQVIIHWVVPNPNLKLNGQVLMSASQSTLNKLKPYMRPSVMPPDPVSPCL